MIIVGAVVRVVASQYAAAWQALAALPGVTPFALDDANRLGVVIEAHQLDDAYRLLNEKVRTAPGVLMAYPAYAQFDDGD